MTSTPTITAPAKEWIRALAVAGVAATRRAPLPILRGVFITRRAQHVTVQTYDYDTAATTILDAADVAGLNEGQRIVASRAWLNTAVKATTGRSRTAPVELRVEGKNVVVRACGYELTSETMPADEYPDIADSVAPTLSVATKQFVETVKRVASAVSPDETLPLLTGIQFQFGNGAVQLYATDRYRLTTESLPCNGAHDGSVVLNARKLISLLGKLDDDMVQIGVSGERVTFGSGRNTFTITTTSGDYPKLAALFPEAVEFVVEADKFTLVESTRVAQSLQQRNLPCILRVTEGGATVTFSDGLFEETKAPKAAGTIVAGTVPTVGAFNPAYLLDALQSVKTDKVRISMNAPFKPWVFTPEGTSATEPNTYRYLLMPVRLPQN